MAHRLNRQLRLESSARVPDGAGGFRENWTSLGTLWAKVTARSGRETRAGAAPLSQVSYTIILRAAPITSPRRPKPDQRFADGPRLFRILSVTEDDQDARFLRCTAREETVA